MMTRTARIVIGVLAFFLLATEGFAQQVLLSGTVRDSKESQPLPGVVVSLKSGEQTRVKKYTVTKKDGSWQMSLSEFPKGQALRFSLMGYATITVPIEEGKCQYDMALDEQTVKLKEVIVKSPNIRQRGDTLSYNVASFADGSDKTLADVLKKMPGIEVSENGEIRHNGKPLNKFYIEGHDMLGGRYSLATANIHQKDVATVEVLQNHQPVKALEDMSFSDNPAINIRLKEAAKSRLVGTLKAGGGVDPNVWVIEGTLMRFAKKTQSLNTVKSNNIGENIGKEGDSLIPIEEDGLLGKDYNQEAYIDLAPDRLTDIDENRTRENQSHSVSLNNLWAIGKSTDISMQVIYNHDRLESSSRSSTSYFLNDSTIVNEENQQAKTKQDMLTASVALNTNTPKLYLSNTLSTDLKWNDAHIKTAGNYPNTQDGDLPSYKVRNSLELLRRNGNKTFNLNSYTTFTSNPHTLHVTKAGEEQHQTVRSATFYSNNSTSLGFYLRPFTISMKAGLIILSRDMESELRGLTDSLGLADNHVGMNFLRIYAAPEAEYNANGWNIRLSMPLSYTPYFYKDKLADDTNNHHKLQASPRLFAKYAFSSHLDMSLSASLTQQEVSEQDFYSGLIMSDYRNLNHGYIDYASDNTKQLSLSMNYKQPLHTLFANASVSKSRSESHRISARDFKEDYIINYYQAGDTHSDSWLASGRIAKGLGFLHGMLSLSASYMNYEGTMLQTETLSNFRLGLWNVSTRFNVRPANFLYLMYDIDFSHDRMKLKEIGLTTSSSSLSQHLDCRINITKHWLIKISGNHYSNQVSESEHKQLVMVDASTSYSFKNGMELSLNATNLFNKNEYSYTVLSNLTRTSRMYTLRPRNIYATLFIHY